MTPSFQVVVGDALTALSMMGAGSVECVITDIPYNQINRETNGLRVIDKGEADGASVPIRRLVRELIRVCSGSIYVWCGDRQLSVLLRCFHRAGLSTRSACWVKSDGPVLNGEHLWTSGYELCAFARKPDSYFARHCKPPVWRGPVERNIDWHPTPKPEWLMRELVTASCPQGGTVLDPYMGSGTVGVAAISTGRHFIGCELNPEWAAKATARIGDAPLPLLLEGA